MPAGTRTISKIVARCCNFDVVGEIDLRNVLERIAYDRGLRGELCRMRHLLKVAASAYTKVPATRLYAIGRRLDHLDDLSERNSFLPPNNPHANAVADRRECNKDRYTLGKADTVAVRDDTFDPQIDLAVVIVFFFQ